MVGMVVIVVVVVVMVVIVRTSAKYQPKLTPSPLARICPTLPPPPCGRPHLDSGDTVPIRPGIVSM